MTKNKENPSLALAFSVIAQENNLSDEEVENRINALSTNTQADKNTKLLTKKEVIKWLHISQPTLYRYVKIGKLKKVTLSKHAVRITEDSVNNLLNINI